MKKNFEEMEVWQCSYKLGKELGLVFYSSSFKNFSFQDQIMRATLSISNNIAEGNNRGSAKDFMKFLFIAKGSCAEVQNMLYFAYDFGYINDIQKIDFINQTSSIVNQLGKFISYLQTKS